MAMTDPDVQFSEGVAMHRAGRLSEAAATYDRVLAAVPGHADALHMRGVIYMQQGQAGPATELIRKSLALKPDQPQALNNYGLALMELRKAELAIDAFREATRLNPAGADAWANLGNALRRDERYPDAVKAYEQALHLAPARAGLHSALGVTLAELGRFEEAFEHHRRAIEMAPAKADYRNNCALSLVKAGREDEAEEMLQLALSLNPNEGEYHAALAGLLKRQGRVQQAIASYRMARERGAESKSIDRAVLFDQNYVDADPISALQDAKAFAQGLSAGLKPHAGHDNDRDSERRLKIGLVSGDFRRHPVGRFMIEPVSQLDPKLIELFAYSVLDNGDELNLQFRRLIPNWRTAGAMSDEMLAEQVRRDGIDILVDLSGITSGGRLGAFARKPAPVAVTYLGYFATTGLESIDYVLANRWLVPPEEQAQWVETPWHLPRSHLCFQRPPAAPPVAAAPRIASGQFTFGSFNNLNKYSAQTLKLWARILNAAPGSRLLMRNTADGDGPSKQIIQTLAEGGIEPERVQFEPVIKNYQDHLAGYGRLDLALDPFPYNGGTTTVEALYMGVPVLTLHGDRYVAHMSESILRSAGLDELVAADADAYVAKAVEAAQHPERLDPLRAGLRAQVEASTLFDAKAFAADLEQAFRGMWRAWCARA